MKKILVIDVGNTNIVCGIYNNNEIFSPDSLTDTFRMASDRIKTSDEYYVLIKNLSGDTEIDYICVSSVVPAISRTIEHMIIKYYKVPYYFVTGNSDLGLRFSIPDPGYIGPDLIVNAYSAWKKYNKNTIICDFGTATTVQFIDSEGFFHGTAILPGLITGAYNLFEKAALLSNIQLESPNEILGTNTRDALLSGLIRGHAFSMDGFVKAIKEKYKDMLPLQTIATGGIAGLVSEQSASIDIVDKSLTLDGLYLIARKKIVTN